MPRLFISHSSANNASALALASWLENNGWSDYFLDISNDRGIAPGERWMAALAGAVDRCEAVIFLVSSAWRDSKYCFTEFWEAKKLGKRIFGAMIEPMPLSQLPEQMTAEWQVCDLTDSNDPVSFKVARLPLVHETIINFPRAGLEALARGLRKAGLDASTFPWPPDGHPDRSPYPGLRALEEADAAVFFGREAAIVRAIDQIRLLRERDIEQLFVILGASGAGKSSFLRAGLLQRLRRDSEHFIVLPTIRPERAAILGINGLVNSLKGALAAAGQLISLAQVREELASVGLAGILQRIQRLLLQANYSRSLAKPTFIVPIDQAEELFSSDGWEESQQFLSYIEAAPKLLPATEPTAADGRRLRILFLMTIRSDSLPKLQDQAALEAMPPVLFSLPAMPISEFRAVIEGPAKRHTETVKPLIISPQLTEHLVLDAQGADALPLLALTLEWLYREFTNSQGTRIGYEEYQQLGGVRGVIGMVVQRAFEQPGREPAIPVQKQDQERLLQQMFPYIATVDPDTGSWKRRLALRAVMRQKLPQAEALVSRLVEQRLLLTDTRSMADGAEPVEVVEVAHEALLRQWDTLERWLYEFAEALSASESIRRSANDWYRSNKDKALLVHTAHRLKSAEALLSDERLEGRFERIDEEYLDACRQRDKIELLERENQLNARAALQRRVTWGLSGAALVVLGLLVWIVVQTREVSLQTSLVLAGAAEVATDQKRFDEGLRLGVLAAKASWLHPAHTIAAPVLSRAADGNTLRVLLKGSKGDVINGSLSLDVKRVLTASGYTANLWDADTGEPIGRPMPNEVILVDLVKFSSDGKRVVTAPNNRTIRVWDAYTGNPLSEPMTHNAEVSSASFSRNGRRVVTISKDNTARIWDADTGKPVGEPMIHRETVKSASFSPNGKRVVTASEDNTAGIWDTDTGKPVGAPMTHGGPVNSASFSPDGKRVVTASWDRKVRVWDGNTGKPVGEPMIYGSWAISPSFSHDGKRVITASEENIARVWDADTGHPVGEQMIHGAGVNSASFSPDGRRVVTASKDETARIWNADTGKPVGEQMIHGAEVNSASFSPDGRRVVTASKDKTARIWDADTGKPVGNPMIHGDEVISAGFSSNGRRVVAVSWDRTTRVWDADTGKTVGEPMIHGAEVNSASFSPDGRRVVTASKDKTIRIWDADSGKLVAKPIISEYQIFAPSFSRDGKRLVMISFDNKASVWDVDTGKQVGVAMTHREIINSVKFSPDGKRVVTTSNDNTARVWDADTGKPVGEPMIHIDRVYSPSFSQDGKRVVMISFDNKARVWDVDTGKQVGVAMAHREPVKDAGFSYDGKYVFTFSADLIARFWDADTGTPLDKPILHGAWMLPTHFSPDGKRWVSAYGKTALLRDTESGKVVGEPMIHGAEVNSVSFSPDGKRVVTASKDSTTRVWDAETGKPVGEPMIHNAEVNLASFSPDGERVVTASKDTTARIWNVFWSSLARHDNLIEQICQHKLHGPVRMITETDVRAARILSPKRVGEDVCAGVTTASIR